MIMIMSMTMTMLLFFIVGTRKSYSVSICTNGTIGIPIDKSFLPGSQVLMIEMQLANQLNEKLTIRTNGTNRQASFTMVNQWFDW